MFNKALPELLPLTFRQSNAASLVADATHLIDSLPGELSATKLSSRHQRAGKEQRKLNFQSDRQFQKLGQVLLWSQHEFSLLATNSDCHGFFNRNPLDNIVYLS